MNRNLGQISLRRKRRSGDPIVTQLDAPHLVKASRQRTF